MIVLLQIFNKKSILFFLTIGKGESVLYSLVLYDINYGWVVRKRPMKLDFPSFNGIAKSGGWVDGFEYHHVSFNSGWYSKPLGFKKLLLGSYQCWKSSFWGSITCQCASIIMFLCRSLTLILAARSLAYLDVICQNFLFVLAMDNVTDLTKSSTPHFSSIGC